MGFRLANKAQLRLFYCLFIGVICLGLFISLLFHGGPGGLHVDDYSFKRRALDLVTGKWQPQLIVEDLHFRPLANTIIANLAVAIPDAELPLRMLWALIHLANAALVGLLIYRVLGSHLAVALSALIFLVPVPATESLLWHTGAGGSSLAATQFLLAIHALLTAIQREKRWIAPFFIGIVCLIMVLATYEQDAIGVVMLPLFSIVALWEEEKSRRKRGLLRACLLTGVALSIALFYWFIILSRAWTFDLRGGLDLNVSNILARRIPEIFGRVKWLTFGEWGLGGMWNQAFLLGIDQVFDDPRGPLVLGALILMLIGLVASSTEAMLGHQTGLSDNRRLACLFLIGISLSIMGFFPAIVIRNQIIESRMMYFPWIGFTVAVTAFLEYVIRGLTRRMWWPGQVVMLTVGFVYLMGVVTFAGFAHVYRLRAEHDQRQISALLEAVHGFPLGQKIVLLPIRLDERSVRVSTSGVNLLDKYLLGVFETPWSAADAMRMEQKHPEIEAISSNRWEQMSFTRVHRSPSGHVESIVVNERLVATNVLLPFTYEDEKAVLLDPLVFVTPSGVEISGHLPLVERVRRVNAMVRKLRIEVEPTTTGQQ